MKDVEFKTKPETADMKKNQERKSRKRITCLSSVKK